MNLINVNNLNMSSKEIAELVESRHDKVKQSIERLANKGIISQPPMGDGIKSANGVVEKVYVFSGEQGKRDSIIVVAQLSPEFTARLVDRWQELEKRQQLPSDPILAILQSATQTRQIQLEHEQRIAILEAKTTTRDESYFTAAGFCNLKGIKLDRAAIAMMGKLAAQYSRDNSLRIGKVYDSRYGEVNEYHVDALQHAANV